MTQWHHPLVGLLMTSLSSFSDELEKIAKRFPVIKDLEEMKKTLKPGDILVTHPRMEHLRKEGWRHMLLQTALVAFQGTPWTHTGLYVGDGKVVDPAEWKNQAAVHLVNLEDFSKKNHIRVLRVDATSKERTNAVEWAKQQVGKDFDKKHLIRMAFPVSKSKDTRMREEQLKSMICSQMISNAYHGQNFGRGRRISDVRPVDILRSPLTRTVAEFH